MLVGVSERGTYEAINTFEAPVYCPGGSAAQSSVALGNMKVPVSVLCKVGNDSNGAELMRQLQQAGVDTSMVIKDDKESTSLAVLPILKDGKRGCFVNLNANNSFKPQEIHAALQARAGEKKTFRSFLFGYPHLMKHFQGKDLRRLFQEMDQVLDGPILGVDVNGVASDGNAASILLPALPLVDVLHLNQEEAQIITGLNIVEGAGKVKALRAVADVLFQQGVAVVAITLGEHGGYLAVTGDKGRVEKKPELAFQVAAWSGQDVFLPAFPLEEGSEVNANGAGDAFTSGLMASLLWSEPITVEQTLKVALLSALQRVDSRKRDATEKLTFSQIIHLAR